MMAQSKNRKLTKVLLILGIIVGLLSAQVFLLFHGSLLLWGFGLALMLICAMPFLYKNWMKNGKSRGAFILIMAVFSLPPLLIFALALKDYFSH